MPTTLQTTEFLGFLSVTEHPKLGLIGGYLVLNTAGRPLEFHCTTPVKPSRTHEILYGNTLEAYLYGEQIAGTLLSRSKTPVSFVMTDTPAVLAAQENSEIPVGFVFTPKKKKEAVLTEVPQNTTEGDDTAPVETPQPIVVPEEINETIKSFGIENRRLQSQGEEEELPTAPPEVAGLDMSYWSVFKIGNRVAALPGEDERRRNKLLETVSTTARMIDLAEPFTRIRIAIEEAQKAG